MFSAPQDVPMFFAPLEPDTALSTDLAQAPPCTLRHAAEAAAAMVVAFERRPTRNQPPGPASLLLTTSWRPARFTTAILRTHDPEGAPAHKTDLIATNRLSRDAARAARRALVAASMYIQSSLICYAVPGLALVIPRMNVALATVVGEPARLRRYASARSPSDAPIAEARRALADALARNWPAEGNVWQAPLLWMLSGHQRLEACAALPGDVGPALVHYDALRQSTDPITIVRAGGLLLSFLPRKKALGLRLVDIQSL